jgi:rsbT co-antagonist protein RsbR
MEGTKIPEVIERHHVALLEDWTKAQLAAATLRSDLLPTAEMREQSREFLELIRQASEEAASTDIGAPAWQPLREMLARVSRSRTEQGFSPSETATFVFSFKQPLFSRLVQAHGSHAKSLAADLWLATTMLDQLGLFTTEVHQRAREVVILRQQQEMLELSTPVVKLWDGVLALPLIGTLDSARTQVVMESLLQRIVETGAEVAIIDITGVSTVDTLVAQHLIKTITAARLMGADCIVSGIRPQIAATIVHLGVDLTGVVTKASLADALTHALQRVGVSVNGRPARI